MNKHMTSVSYGLSVYDGRTFIGRLSETREHHFKAFDEGCNFLGEWPTISAALNAVSRAFDPSLPLDMGMIKQRPMSKQRKEATK
jgi:hypothetical protein